MLALGIQDPSEYGDTDSVLGDDGVSGPYSFNESLSDGDVVDAVIVDEGTRDNGDDKKRTRRARGRDTASPDSGSARDAKSGPPSLSEWESFFGRVVLRVMCDWYISYAFRGVDEDLLTERELDRLTLSDDERKLIVVPIAELANKSRFMRKHGRMIVASGDAFNAMVVLGAWASRVNRIANKYRPRVVKGSVNGNNGQATEAGTATAEGSAGGRFPQWFNGPIIPGSS